MTMRQAIIMVIMMMTVTSHGKMFLIETADTIRTPNEHVEAESKGGHDYITLQLDNLSNDDSVPQEDETQGHYRQNLAVSGTEPAGTILHSIDSIDLGDDVDYRHNYDEYKIKNIFYQGDKKF